MMFLLTLYVPDDVADGGEAGAERSVAGLPGEARLVGECLVDPFGRVGLDHAHGLGDRCVSAKLDQQMDMILRIMRDHYEGDVETVLVLRILIHLACEFPSH